MVKSSDKKSSELEKEFIFCEDITRLSSANVKKIDDGRYSIQILSCSRVAYFHFCTLGLGVESATHFTGQMFNFWSICDFALKNILSVDAW
jgi:hypothetical protein